jgi:hypothetical protein
MPAKRKSEKKPLICRCTCPYCDTELIVQESPFCDVCKVSFGRCPNCGALIMQEKTKVCVSCGKPLG